MVLRRYASFFYIIPVFAAFIALSGLIPGTSLVAEAQACGLISFPYTLPDNASATLVTAIECANSNGTADIIDLNGFTVSLLGASPYATYEGQTGLPQIISDITLRGGTLHHDMSGGGFLFRTFDITSSGTLTLQNMVMSGDMAPDPGGAFYNLGTVNVISSTLTGYSTSNRGGVLYNGSGATANFTNALLYDNNAVFAHAIDNDGSVNIVNSTFDKHNSVGQFGFVLEGSGYVVRNSILWNPGSGPGQISTGNTVSDSIVKGGYSGGTNILNTDPLFVNEGSNDFRLQLTSPAINVGANTYVPADTADVDGDSNTSESTPDRDLNPRIVAAIVDMGAYERQDAPPTFPMDVDYCNLQFPTSFTAAAGTTSPIIYGRVYEDDNGIFTSSPGAHPSIVGQVGYGPLGSDPRGGNSAWLWFSTTYNIQLGNDDEYEGTFAVPFAPANTQRSYTYRFSVDSGANYTYCDSDGNGTNGGLGFNTASLGTMTINPGGQPTISINDVSLNEGNAGTTSFNFTVSLSGPSLNPVTFDIATANNTATVANSDYTPNSLTGISIPAGQTSTTFTVLAHGDMAFEPNEAFFVNVTSVTGAVVGDGQGTGTIINDDMSVISINDVTLAEGNSGTTAFTFAVSLSGPAASPVTFDITTADGTASDGIPVAEENDYVSISITGNSISAGNVSQSFTVLVNGDTAVEPNETFFVNLTNVTGAVVGDGQGTGTITNDDVDPCVAITFPYTMTGSTPAELIQAINCANANGAGSDTIDLNGQTITLIANYTILYGSGNGLPEITTAVVIQDGTITRSSDAWFRFFVNTGGLTLNNVTLSNADSLADGGAILNTVPGMLIINHGRIIGNYANYGGAIFNGPDSTATLTNTLITGNRSNNQGGGIRNRGTLVLNNSTVAANFTTSGSEGGGGIANGGPYSLTLNNSLVYGNEASTFPAANEMVGVFTNNNSLVGVNPSFVTLLDAGDTAPTTGGDYRLADFSVAIDAGNNNLVPGGVTNDLDGNSRFYNDTGVADTGTGTSPIVDIGAYEKQTSSVVSQADLSITKTDGVTTAVPGGSVTYTITASNAGPSNVTNATVADTFPSILTGTWTCVGAGGGTCTASGAGNISDTVNLPVGGSVTYTVNATISPSATGMLSNTVTVSSGITDPNPANNSATDTDMLNASADLSITKTDGVTSATPGGSVTYTITASNVGPSNVTNAMVADTFPASLTGTWTCVGAGGGTCTAAGAGNISDSVSLPAGGSVTYTVSATISPSATGMLSNTATVSAGGGVTDPNPANNSATDTDTLGVSADLSITKTDGLANVMQGDTVIYTIVASNAGPSNAPSATVADTLPAELSGVTWTCVGVGGGTCTAAGSGNISDTVSLPAGGSVTYSVSAALSLTATGSLSNTATVDAGGITDPDPANNSATDEDNINPLPVNLLKNGGFETAGGKPKNARKWKAEAPAASDKRICKPLIAFEGTCAYRFRFNGTIVGGGAKRAIVQKILTPAVDAGDTLDFSLYARTSGLTAKGRARVIVTYGGGSRQIIKVMIPAGSSPYTLYTASAVLTGTPISIVVKFEPRSSKGTMFVDGVTLTTTATAGTRAILAADVLPLPEAPEGFRR